MSLVNLHARKQRINSLMDLARSHDLLGHDAHQYLCRYICIRLIVYLDKSVGDILSEYCEHRRASEQITQLVESYIARNATNLHCTKICLLLEGIDKSWAQEFKDSVTEDGMKFSSSKIPSQISSLKGTRDMLAHNDEANVRLEALEGYLESVDFVIHSMEVIILGS